MSLRKVDIKNHKKLKLHSFCSMFPEMSEEDFDGLLESMKENGFLDSDPIIVILDDKEKWLILDGQNRYIAANQTKVTPSFMQYNGDDPLGFVIARNMDRRHLNTGQKAAIAVSIVDAGKGIKQKDAAKKAGIGEASLRRFKFIQERDPKLAEKVADGSIKMEKARKSIKDKEKAMHENQEAEDIMPELEKIHAAAEPYKLGDKKRAKEAKFTKVEVTIHAKFQVMYDPKKDDYPDQLAKAIAALEKGGLAEVEVISEGDE
ncbi:ParB N-terminal domain-containing protein [Candidatus Pacearchaeota archaeon]|nr:ParB N-terminal domain-containing protein [Candidatus Pacearchaeota archaeon]